MSQRGQFSLFNTFETKTEQLSLEGRTRNYLMPERNQALVHRFFFYGWMKDFKYSRCLAELEKEFFLSERRLVDILAEVDDQLQNLHRKPPTLKELQAKFPWLNWAV